jgi:hypothetical protein
MRGIVRAVLVSLVVAAPAASAADRSVDGSFSAMAVVDTPQGSRQMGFTIVVSNPMTREQAQPLKKVLEEGGQQALVNAIRGKSQGKFVLGVVEYPVDLVVAEPNDKGVQYYVITARPLRYEEVTDGGESVDFPFTVLAFLVPDFGSGDGKIFTRAALAVDPDGHVRADQYHGNPGVLKDVKSSN